MANTDLLNTPVLWINKYLQEKLGRDIGIGVPFFPPRPFTIDDLTESWVTLYPLSTGEPEKLAYAGVMATWDRLVKMNKKGFPHIKSEQILYYFYATEDESVEKMIKVQEAVLRLLDRFDESAEEINAWCANRSINIGTEQSPEIIDSQFYFHNFKVYQLEETRDIIDFGTARTYGGNKIIIDFDYHQMPDLINTEGPESRLATKIII